MRLRPGDFSFFFFSCIKIASILGVVVVVVVVVAVVFSVVCVGFPDGRVHDAKPFV